MGSSGGDSDIHHIGDGADRDGLIGDAPAPAAVSSIKQQERRKDRFSVYVAGSYAFSLSDVALIESGLHVGQTLSGDDVKRFQRLSAEDKMSTNAIRYAAMRLRSRWEIESYLKRKEAEPELIDQIIERLSGLKLVDDELFARTWVENRHLLKPSSKQKLRQELKAKRVRTDIIDRVLAMDEVGDEDELPVLIRKKRRQSKYRDDDSKLMQYLARQGFGYDDIRTAMAEVTD